MNGCGPRHVMNGWHEGCARFLVPNLASLLSHYPVPFPPLFPSPTPPQLGQSCRVLPFSRPDVFINSAAVQVWSASTTSFSPFSSPDHLRSSHIRPLKPPGFLLMKAAARQEAHCIISSTTRSLCHADRRRTWRLPSGSRSARINRARLVLRAQPRADSPSL